MVPRTPKITIVVRWRPPAPDQYKINIDGSTNAGQMFAGGVIRNSLGFFIAAFSLSLGPRLAVDTEALAGLHGIMFAHSRGWTNLWIKSDSELAVKLLKSNSKIIPWCIKSCWEKFWAIRPNINLQVSHIHREGNFKADTLTKLHCDNVWIGGCPNFLNSMLFTDMHKDYFRAAA